MKKIYKWTKKREWIRSKLKCTPIIDNISNILYFDFNKSIESNLDKIILIIKVFFIKTKKLNEKQQQKKVEKVYCNSC